MRQTWLSVVWLFQARVQLENYVHFGHHILIGAFMNQIILTEATKNMPIVPSGRGKVTWQQVTVGLP
jgi:hypothetical protein